LIQTMVTAINTRRSGENRNSSVSLKNTRKEGLGLLP
jgi:hypothetical protein